MRNMKVLAQAVGILGILVAGGLVVLFVRSIPTSEKSPENGFVKLVASPLGINQPPDASVQVHVSDSRLLGGTDYFLLVGNVDPIFQAVADSNRNGRTLRQVEGGLVPRPEWWPSTPMASSEGWHSIVVDTNSRVMYVFILNANGKQLFIARVGF